jgi:hypothetical protein
VKTKYNPQLEWLYTHRVCNQAYRHDEEYVLTVLAGFARSGVGNAVLDDVRRGLDKGHGVGLVRGIVGSFGEVVGPKGERLFRMDTVRLHRVVRKIVRGVFYLEAQRLLPEWFPADIRVVTPMHVATDLPNFFPSIRDTPSLLRYGRVFDCKWIGWTNGTIRGHALAFLLWDGVIITVLLHDPTCLCSDCKGEAAARDGEKEED